MKQILLALGMATMMSTGYAQNLLVGWHTFDVSTGTAIAAESPDFVKSGFSGLMGTSISGTTQGGGKGTVENVHSTDNTYGDLAAIDPAPSIVSAVLLNSYNNANKKLDIQVTNNTSADVMLSSIQLDYKLSSGVEAESTIKVSHLSGSSDLQDAFNGRNLSGVITATDFDFHNLVVNVSAMADVVLAPGEKASFRIEVGITGTTAAVFNVDNIAIAEASATAINSLKFSDQVKFYPNPATDVINILATGVDIADVQLLDLTGKVVYQSPSTEPISVSSLPKGVYVLKVDGVDGASSASKVMIK